MKSFIDNLRPGEIHVDTKLWGPRSTEVEEFLATKYDPATMPRLAAADVNGREGVWLLGWEEEGTGWPNLLIYLFGEQYRDEQLNRIRMQKQYPVTGEGRFGFGHHRVRP